MEFPRDWKEFEAKLGIPVRNPSLLLEALTHRSFATEQEGSEALGNERLEFLGDAVLGLIVSEHLFQEHPSASEGELTQRKAQLVSRRILARVGREWDLGRWLRMGRGAEGSGERHRPSVLAGAVEALVAAVYLDQGLEAARQVVLRLLEKPLREQEGGLLGRDYKSELQELVQGLWRTTPRYSILSTEGPEHEKWFTVEVQVGSRVLGQGQGRNKKEAEQEAARAALERLWEEMR